MKRTRQFYIPNVSMWNWSLVSPVFVKLQLQRAEQSYKETEDALENIEREIKEIRKQVWAEWGTASANRMRDFARKIVEMNPEVKRIHYVRLKLREVIGEMEAHLG